MTRHVSLGPIEDVPAAWYRAATWYLECADELRRTLTCEWEGLAADAFRAAATKTQKQAEELSEVTLAGSRVISDYLSVYGPAKAAAERAEEDRIDASRRLSADVFDGSALNDLITAKHDFARAQRLIDNAGEEAARRLDALLNQYNLAWGEDWRGPLGWFSRMEPVRENVLDATWDHRSIRQGSQGTCYLIAALVSIMRFDDGDEFLRNHVRWNAGKELFEVTLYVDGIPRLIEVDYIYQRGSNHAVNGPLWFDLHKPNVVSIYEAAVGQVLGWDDLVSGGDPAWAMEIVTGRPASSHYMPHMGDYPLNELRQAVRSSEPIIGGTTENGHIFTGVDVERPDGRLVTTEVEIVGGHAYSIERAEIDGSVWVRNPHGPGNTHDSGGLIHLTQEQFLTSFEWVSIMDRTFYDTTPLARR
ncbi:MAG: C2 family cysteine protease [Micrococcales bacterium]|nr:C2 family cysteine protease [Micrococcales bacterium]